MSESITINGHQIFYKSRPDFWKSVEDGSWEPDTFKVLDRFVKPGKTFIDIGAWNGICSLYASKLGAKCYAIEPDYGVICELLENLALNYNDTDYSVLVEHSAISYHIGASSLNSMTSDGFGNSESSLIDRGTIKSRAIVSTTTLQAFIEKLCIKMENVCLIKMDIEGGEILVIEQAKKFLQKYTPTMYISFHPAWILDLKRAIAMIQDVLFPFYDFEGVKTQKKYTSDEFEAALNSHEHSFILTKKN